MFRSSNPVLSERALHKAQTLSFGDSMTVQGTVNKSFILLGLILASAAFVWSRVMQTPVVPDWGETTSSVPTFVGPLMLIGGLGGFMMAIITVFNQKQAGITAPIYAILKGLFLGGISALFEQAYPGIVINAVVLTLGTLFCMLLAYTSGMVRVTDKFRMGLLAATGSVCLLYIGTLLLRLFGVSVPFIHGSGLLGIGFSLVVVVIAALNLVLDFDLIVRGSGQGLPKYMEWYCAFGLMVTLVWLYIEMLRLLAKLRDRR